MNENQTSSTLDDCIRQDYNWYQLQGVGSYRSRRWIAKDYMLTDEFVRESLERTGHITFPF
jgi:hypothetical protein